MPERRFLVIPLGRLSEIEVDDGEVFRLATMGRCALDKIERNRAVKFKVSGEEL